jgi:hypothetical protein
MTTVTPSHYAKFAAALLADTLIENRRHELESILARYLQLHGMTEDYQLHDDLLWGAVQIAAFLGVKPKRVFGWIESGRFPHVHMGNGSISARKSVIHCYVMAQELASIKGISLRHHVSGEGTLDAPNDNGAPARLIVKA